MECSDELTTHIFHIETKVSWRENPKQSSSEGLLELIKEEHLVHLPMAMDITPL